MEQSNHESCKDSILVFVNLSWYDPDVYLTDSGDLEIVDSSQYPALSIKKIEEDEGEEAIELADISPSEQEEELLGQFDLTISEGDQGEMDSEEEHSLEKAVNLELPARKFIKATDKWLAINQQTSYRGELLGILF